MKIYVCIFMVMATTTSAFAGEGVYIPWDEFKVIYRERIEFEIRKELEQELGIEKESIVAVPFVYSIDEAQYQLDISKTLAQGNLLLSGKIIGGPPELIPLFAEGSIITSIESVSGGTILSDQKSAGFNFLPDVNATEFQVSARYLIKPVEGHESQQVTIGIPPALRNSLQLALPPESHLVEEPGIADTEGLFHFSSRSELTVKYMGNDELAVTSIIDLDTVSRIAVQKGQIFITSYFHPERDLPETLTLIAPEGAKYIASSLKASWIKSIGDERYELSIPKGIKGFSVEFALDAFSEDDVASITLPVIEDNNGQQGRFVVDEPDNGQVSLTANGLVSQVPIGKLGDAFSGLLNANRFYNSVPSNEKIDLALKRFEPIPSPATVLENQYFFSSFEENGNILSVLMLTVSPDAGPRLKLYAVPGAEIWSLTVNDVKKNMYAGEEGAWIIPLDEGQESTIKLSYLTRGSKLGLQGRLEAVVPKNGLPSRNVCVGIALPERVELLSMEGPVNPTSSKGIKLPSGFEGKHYFFSRSFYDGEGMSLAIAYKEPSNNRKVAKQ